CAEPSRLAGVACFSRKHGQAWLAARPRRAVGFARGGLRGDPLQDSSHAPGAKGLEDEPRTDPAERNRQIAAWSLLILATIAVGEVLYAARVLMLPIVAAFVIGAMLSPAAKFLERYKVPRFVSAVAIVVLVAGLIPSVIALISAPLTEWMGRL